jgi:hypothetical protein
MSERRAFPNRGRERPARIAEAASGSTAAAAAAAATAAAAAAAATARGHGRASGNVDVRGGIDVQPQSRPLGHELPGHQLRLRRREGGPAGEVIGGSPAGGVGGADVGFGGEEELNHLRGSFAFGAHGVVQRRGIALRGEKDVGRCVCVGGGGGTAIRTAAYGSDAPAG